MFKQFQSFLAAKNLIRCTKRKCRNLIFLFKIKQFFNYKNLRKYDVFANELGLIHECKTRIIPYVLTWDGIVTKYHAKYRKELAVSDQIEAFIQSITLKKTLESVSMDFRRGADLTIEEPRREENLRQKFTHVEKSYFDSIKTHNKFNL